MFNKEIVVKAFQIANRNLLCCSPNTPIYQGARLIQKRKTSSILVEENDRVIGIWTEADCTKLVFDDVDNFTKPISQYMSTPVISIKAQASLQEIIMAFHRHRVRHLLVVDENDKTIGITSQTDVIKKQGDEHYFV